MYLGRYLQGREAVIRMHLATLCTAVTPAAAPRVTVYDATGAVVGRSLAYRRDAVRAPTLFACRIFLASAYPAGRYLVSFTFADSVAARTQVGHFDVVAGDAAGAVVSQYFLTRPHAAHLVQKTASGRRFFKRSPYI